MDVNWPQLVVRTWQGVLSERDRDYYDSDHDILQEATISQRMHELRGLVVGQVSEIEWALLDIASEIRERHPDPLHARPKRIGAGGALNDVRKLLAALSLGDTLVPQLEAIGHVIDRRNRLIHARIGVGFDRLGPNSGLEPVIYLLLENDADELAPPKDVNDAPDESQDSTDSWEEGGEDLWDLPEDEMEYGQIDELGLKKYLEEAYAALEAAVDIWQLADQVLPDRTFC